MLKNYLVIGWRNLVRAAGFSVINILGLGAGLTIALFIGLWVYDELSFNKSFANHDRLAQLFHRISFGEQDLTIPDLPYPIGEALKSSYPELGDIAMGSGVSEHILAHDETILTETGIFIEPFFLKMFSIKMTEGTADALKEIHSIMLSETVARKIFGDQAMGKMLRFDNREQFMVTGVFEDFPGNSHFAGVEMLLPIEYFFASNKVQSDMRDSWEHYSFECFVLLNPSVSPIEASAKVEHLLFDNASDDGKAVKPKGFLFPMEKWHLYADFDDAFPAPSRIRFVWMFGLIGTFVLVLACINFMNLSTARSEMRSKEVGVRKVMGSLRHQLIRQFLIESLMVVIIGFLLALLITWGVLPAFNELSGKKITLPADRPIFYIVSISFIFITAFLAGSYPAFYLSSFSPVRVLKGTFKASRYARVPRKVMVVFQFTISLILIIGTAVVFLQIRHAKDRPVGFDREGIIQLTIRTKELADADYNTLRADLLSTGVVENMAKSDFPITGGASADASLTWEGKDPAFKPLIALNSCSHDFPATNGFQFVAGRDFSRDISSDSSAMIVNEMAAELLGTDVIGKKLRFGIGREFQIVGVIKDQVRSTPFSKQSPHIYFVRYSGLQFLTIRFNRGAALQEGVQKVEDVIRKHDPGAPFEYKFQDEDYARLFHDDERLGKLAAVFSSLAIFISCIGMFGLAAFAASQRIKEIGIRKVLGASAFGLWRMLSVDFLMLTAIAIAISFPSAYYLASQWLQQYDYRVEMSWPMFALTGILALIITLVTVSYQALRAAWTNPANTLRRD